MKKEYRVDVDITCSTIVFLEAETEDEAKRLAKEKIMREQGYWLGKGTVVDVNITDVEPE